jgi:uncharacterized protein (DUF305 family)
MTTRTIALATTAALATTLLAGCAPTISGMPGNGMGPNASSSPAAPSSPATSDAHNNADAMFTMMMIPHHQQAIEMSDMIIAKSGIDPQITELAQTIKDAQQPEITQMQGWLDAWGVGDPNDMMDDMDHGTGMMSDGDMSALESATGADAGRIYLDQMIQHHEGAIDMATDEVDDGQNPDAITLAKNIITSQTAEIKIMTGLLNAS